MTMSTQTDTADASSQTDQLINKLEEEIRLFTLQKCQLVKAVKDKDLTGDSSL